VLDIGAGSGDQTLGAARRVGMTGTVLATDISPSMLELTAMAARQAGLPNIHTQMMDAQQLELPADSFDVVISRFALMLIPDIHKALSEIRRALRSGGTLWPTGRPIRLPRREHTPSGGAVSTELQLVRCRRDWRP
jgi:ubiquinone/menaquinone biosynthesis C-methylase UbiE